MVYQCLYLKQLEKKFTKQANYIPTWILEIVESFLEKKGGRQCVVRSSDSTPDVPEKTKTAKA